MMKEEKSTNKKGEIHVPMIWFKVLYAKKWLPFSFICLVKLEGFYCIHGIVIVYHVYQLILFVKYVVHSSSIMLKKLGCISSMSWNCNSVNKQDLFLAREWEWNMEIQVMKCKNWVINFHGHRGTVINQNIFPEFCTKLTKTENEILCQEK